MDVLDMFRLDGKVAIVTGASSGLGVAFAQALAQAGADVALGARRVDRLEQTKATVEALGRRAVTVADAVEVPLLGAVGVNHRRAVLAVELAVTEPLLAPALEDARGTVVAVQAP